METYAVHVTDQSGASTTRTGKDEDKEACSHAKHDMEARRKDTPLNRQTGRATAEEDYKPTDRRGTKEAEKERAAKEYTDTKGQEGRRQGAASILATKPSPENEGNKGRTNKG